MSRGGGGPTHTHPGAAPEAVRQAVGGGCQSSWGGYCRLQMPLKLAFAVRETVAGHRLGALEGGGCPPFQCIPAPLFDFCFALLPCA